MDIKVTVDDAKIANVRTLWTSKFDELDKASDAEIDTHIGATLLNYLRRDIRNITKETGVEGLSIPLIKDMA